tara:strand:+ start:111 stop:371 length:261 start_codon:yes stop_codon:yes gene_type:complete
LALPATKAAVACHLNGLQLSGWWADESDDWNWGAFQTGGNWADSGLAAIGCLAVESGPSANAPITVVADSEVASQNPPFDGSKPNS